MKWGDVIERDLNLNDYVWRTISIRESQFKQGWGRDEPLNKCKNRTMHFFYEVPIFLALSSNFQSPGTHSKIDPLKGNIDHVLLFSQK